ncbi:inositol transport system substrate-binding protein [Pasteurella testudinis DSM 23072]|uniref:Inositol transport system substrate-binding protein n=1 Tax=Pasteurella testudinis DSM 23072 TaxID=1122938 RepID=A0A1W1UTP8_9PAST|nr:MULTISPECIES: substrate-binding domain-containing protein [Pasteurellaceae]TNH05424.1 sugar ABC transporter substrate-binding protein [Pasteurellaceae bacterium Phil11]TNH21542.1 sugar ABC transporter substrate-binding protein [Testudinibacter sp. TR-2022]TNH25943.1 sugar ABC transporter substrate-binding protein [Testudinibacter sp. TR-2022]SMB84433.1 inositol transport system substrate-binding protein [Pasteurella testudinis DSM 23072]SUB50406.1 D-ribose-binding periplasmic protein RbsB-1
MRKINQLVLLLSAGLALNAFAKNEVVAFSSPSLYSPFQIKMSQAAAEAGKALELKVQVLDGQDSSTKQTSDVDNSITKGAKAILIAPNDVNAIAAAVEDAINAGVVVATVDRKVISEKNIPHFGANNYLGGQKIAQELKAKFPDGANIILLTGQPGSTSNIERTQGIRDELKSYGTQYKIIVDQSGNWLRSEGLRIIESVLPTLKQKPDVILSANDDMAMGAIEALRALGYKAGDITVTGFDAGPEALSRIQDDWLYVTADQRPSYAVSTALSQIAGNLREGKAIQGLDFAPLIIKKQNVREAERITELKD